MSLIEFYDMLRFLLGKLNMWKKYFSVLIESEGFNLKNADSDMN